MSLAREIVQLCYRMEDSPTYRRTKGFFFDLLENPRARVRPYFDSFMILLVLTSVSVLIYEVRDDLGLAGDLFEAAVVSLFIVEYLLRMWVYNDSHKIFIEHYERAEFVNRPFLLGPALLEVVSKKWDYVTSPLAVIDLLAIVPSYRPLRILRIFLLFRLFKLFRYAHSVHEFGKVLAQKKFELFTLAIFMAFLVFSSASALYFFEADFPESKINSFFDGIYWSLVTISTVGYGDITPVTGEGRLVTMVLIVAGVGLIAFFTSIIVSAFSEKMPEVQARRVFAELEKRGRHTILCGYGRMGRVVAARLQQEKERFVVIEPDAENMQQAKRLDYLVIQGNAQDNELLANLNIARARRILCLTGDDVVNVYISLSARQLHPGIEIVARANQRENVKKLRRAGADFVVEPFEVVGLIAAEYVGQPVAFEVFYGMFTGNKQIHTDAIRVHEGSSLEGRRLGDIPFKDFRLILFGVVTDIGRHSQCTSHTYDLTQQRFFFNPGAEFELLANDMIVVFGHDYSMLHFKECVELGKI